MWVSYLLFENAIKTNLTKPSKIKLNKMYISDGKTLIFFGFQFQMMLCHQRKILLRSPGLVHGNVLGQELLCGLVHLGRTSPQHCCLVLQA